MADNILYAFYDLSVAPTTFDFVKFLAIAELHRQQNNCICIHAVIVSGLQDGFRKGDLLAFNRGHSGYSKDIMDWRLRNIIIPCCWQFPTCKEVSVFKNREEANEFYESVVTYVYPPGYSVKKPIIRHYLKYIVNAVRSGKDVEYITANEQALVYVKDWIDYNVGDRKPIVITLRELPYNSARNSNLVAWASFAKSLDKDVYVPIFLRDTERTLTEVPNELEDMLVFNEASFNIDLRTALYELSYLNMSINNGPMYLFLLNKKARGLVFKMVTNEVASVTYYVMSMHGLKKGDQFDSFLPNKRLVWEVDSTNVLVREFNKSCKEIGD